MLKANSKGLFLQISEFGIQAARVGSLEAPYSVEKLEEFSLAMEAEELSDGISALVGGKRGQLSFAVCGVYPPRRVIRRATLENLAKAKDPAFLSEYLKNQFKIDLGVYSMAALNASDGLPFGTEKVLSKEIVFCGAPKDELRAEQERLVALGVFPQRMEIGTMATMGGLMQFCKAESIKSPTLVLEIASEGSQVLIYNNGQMDVARPIPQGLNSMYPVVQKELGLKDEESAKKLFTSNTFDFTEMGPLLLRKIMKELQASTGFYEVQTGQTIGQIYLGLLPENLSWIGSSLARSLGVDELKIDLAEWTNHHGINVDASVELTGRGARWFGLFSLMGDFNPRQEAPQSKNG